MFLNNIKIDVDGQKDIQGITLTSGDTGYGLILEFYKGGALFDITGYNIAVYAKLTGLDAPIPDIGTVANGKGYYIIKPSMYVYGGETQLEIVLTDNTGSHVVTKVLHCPVRSGFSAGQTIAEADYNVLATLIQQAQAATANANNAAAYARALYGVRSATIKIAASNATEKSKAAADYVCTGENDEVIINAAIAELDGIGGCVELSEGTFNVAGTIGDVGQLDNIWIKGQGYSTVVVGLDYGISITTTAGIAKVSDMSVTAGESAIVVETDSKAHISFCNVYDCGGTAAIGAIQIKGTATVTNCEVADNARYGIRLNSTVANCVITNNRFSNNTAGNISDIGTNNIAENNAEVSA